uniref:Serine esterase (DUF676) n=1 Tax=Candidatus Kentrum sp. TUN TaxID=2126343 RepID=A0A450ZZ93_9GAMM|nr:MAG: Putative serine esterase (DUF676) [Candidatus Kentron sp. TUN]VFK67876.1 MAG: Putative serine esterase (DUF676) [Candidatus Kentron sp. TUN]
MSELRAISQYKDSTYEADVVFVHGLGGDAFETWQCDQKDPYDSWPYWLADEFPNVRVWSLDYPASLLKPSPFSAIATKLELGLFHGGHAVSLPERAAEVLGRLENYDLGKRPILFICHSLGGLLTKQLLRKASDDVKNAKNRAIFDNTRAVLFLATPHLGAKLASLLSAFKKILGTTVSIEDLKIYDDHLLDLYEWYRDHSTRIQTDTYYEGYDTRGVRIVSRESSHPGVGAVTVSDEDHLSIAKPCGRNSPVYGAVCRLLREHVLVSEPGDGNIGDSGNERAREKDSETPPIADRSAPDPELVERHEAMLPKIEKVLDSAPDVRDTLGEVIREQESINLFESEKLADHLLGLGGGFAVECFGKNIPSSVQGWQIPSGERSCPARAALFAYRAP